MVWSIYRVSEGKVMEKLFDGMRLYRYTYLYVIASVVVYLLISLAAIWSAVAQAGMEGSGGAW